MRKVLALVLALLLPAVALADDLAAMSTDGLLQLRRAVDQEIAARVGSDDAQSVSVDGVVFRLLLAEVGQARDDMPGLGVVLRQIIRAGLP